MQQGPIIGGAIMLGFVWAATAHADQTYYYTGLPFNSGTLTGNVFGIVDYQSSSNFSYTLVSGQTVLSGNSGCTSCSSFYLNSTDIKNYPVAVWYLSAGSAGPPHSAIFIGGENNGVDEQTGFEELFIEQYPGGPYYTGTYSGPSLPGTWSTTPPTVTYVVTKNFVNNGTQNNHYLNATGYFISNGSEISLNEAELITGYSSFAFVQEVTSTTDPNPGCCDVYGNPFNPPWFDTTLLSYPYYPVTQVTANSISMYDNPHDPEFLCPVGNNTCGHMTLTTELVGVLPDDHFKVLNTFVWGSSWTGTGGPGIIYQGDDIPTTDDVGGFGSIYPIASDVDVNTLPLSERLLLSQAGAVGVSAVPEPTTWALTLVGFAGLGIAGFRRQWRA